MKPDVWIAIEQLWFPDKPDEAHIFTDWLSVMIELPHLKITWAPILRSQQGVGKGILLEHVIRRILGDHAVKEMNFSRLTGQFSGDQLLSRLVVLNEVRAKTAANYNNLKDKITDPWHYVERKGEQAVTMRTSFCTLLFSNEPKPLSIAQDDRRYWLPDFITLPKEWGAGDQLQKNKQKVFTGLVDNLKNGGAKELAMFFKWNVHNQNDPATIYDEAPLSEAKDQIQSNRTEDASDRLIMYLQKIGHEEGFKISDLQKKFTPDLSDYDVMTICKKLGYCNNDNKKITVNNHRQRVWAKDHSKVNSLHVVNSNGF